MVNTDSFKAAYANLNVKQKEAVDAIFGPVMVIAGPGTGKTQILALRIGNILLTSTGTKPDEILALTYTESAVATLRNRLAVFIGAAAHRVRIHTFHSFARSILELRPDLFPRIVYGTSLSEVQAVELMQRLLDAGSYTKIRNPKNPHRLVKQLITFIATLKQEHYTPERYLQELSDRHSAILTDPNRLHTTTKRLGQEKGEYTRQRERIEKHMEVGHLFAAYETALEQESLYDYEDLITQAIHGLETDEGFRSQVGERSQFVLADEHQDSNPSQNRLLELVTDFDGAPNVFIVGDEKQAIYRFQGASLDSFFYFKDRYPNAKIISLEENYRSTTTILTTAHDLIAPAPIPDPAFRPILTAVRGKGGQIMEAVYDTPLQEREAIAAYIQGIYSSNEPYESIAILTRRNADVLALADFLRRKNIPEDHVSAEISVLSHPEIVLFIALIRAMTDLTQDAALARALFMPGAPGSLAERMRLLASTREGKPLSLILEERGTAEMRTWIRHLTRLAEEMHGTLLIPWLSRLAQESGFLVGLFGLGENEDAYIAYQGFMEEAELLTKENPGATAVDFINRLALIEQHELKLKRARTKRDGVRIMTVHASKGLEFSHVIIAHASDERWLRGKTNEFSLPSDNEDDEEDVRRLVYVALTRAKDTVLITRSHVTEEDRAQTPLRFLADIAPHLVAANPVEHLPPPMTHSLRSVLDPAFLKELLLAQGFSPTGFNNYVTSVWQYYFRTLLRIPGAPTLSLSFGTAIHAGLKAYATALKEHQEEPNDVAIAAFRRELDRLPLTSLDREALTSKGEMVLHAYLASEGATMHRAHELEFSIEVPFTVPGVGEIPLTGRLDRIDMHDDGTVEVIDYKTGSAKSENEIRGLTKSSDGNYYRQLVFYKLLLTMDGRYTMKEGSLHFVEPNDSGSISVRKFTISDAEVASLQADIIRAAQAISDGSAFTSPCDPEICDYCDLVATLLKQ